MLSFDWEEFLELAERLVRWRGDVSAERSAISRAYYAVFHDARAYVTSQGERLTLTGADHTMVWDWFLRPGADSLSRRIGNRGHLLRRARRMADYDPAPNRNLSFEAAEMVTLAQQLLNDLRRLR